MKQIYLLTLSLALTANVLLASPPCTPHAGRPFPGEGSGACTGNELISIPLPTLNMSLYYNTLEAQNNFGVGGAGWRLSFDNQVIKEVSGTTVYSAYLLRADGTRIDLQSRPSEPAVWEPTNLLLSRTRFNMNESAEKPGMGMSIYYTEIATKSLANGNTQSVLGVSRIVDSNGNTTQYERNSSTKKLERIILPSGKTIVFTWENSPDIMAMRRLKSIRDMATNAYQFVYNDTGNDGGRLNQVIYPETSDGWDIYYATDTNSNKFLVKRIVEPTGDYKCYTYASTTKLEDVCNVISPAGSGMGCDTNNPIQGQLCATSTEKLDFIYRKYNQNEKSVETQTKIDRLTEYFNADNRLVRSVDNGLETIYLLNSRGLPSTVTTALKQTRGYTYDARLNLVSAQYENGITKTYSGYNSKDLPATLVDSSALGRITTSYSWDSEGRLLSTNSPGRSTAYLRDTNSGNITRITKNGVIVKSFAYDEVANTVLGLTTTVADINGNSTHFTYSGDALASSTDTLGYQTIISQVDGLGNATDMTSPGGIRTLRSYDKLGRLTSEQVLKADGTEVTSKTISLDNGGNSYAVSEQAADYTNSYERSQSAGLSAKNSKRPTYKRLLDLLGESEAYADTGVGDVICKVKNVVATVSSQTQDVGRKPIIYLYPEKTQEVSVKLDLKGSFIATYPEIDPKTNSWTVEAKPDGTLKNKSDGKEYSYIFWEAQFDKNLEFNEKEGFVVAGKDARAFLQDKLSQMGLTPREYNEFIVYWYPRMAVNEWNYVHFVGKSYTDAAKLDITPKPDSMLRVFMVFQKISSPDQMKVKPQTFEKFERKGFTVVEWGGHERPATGKLLAKVHIE